MHRLTSCCRTGTICWTIQLVPQVWKSWRTKSTDGLSEYLVYVRSLSLASHLRLNTGPHRLLWGVSGAFFGVYAVVQNLNVPLIVQPQLLSFLSYTSWAQVRPSLSVLMCQHLSSLLVSRW